MDKAYIEQHHVIERYVQGRLADDELTAFERHMLDHPEVADEVQYAKGLTEGLRGASRTLAANAAKTVNRRWFASSAPVAAAATVLLAVTILSVGYVYQLGTDAVRLEQPDAATSVAAEIFLEPLRGGAPTLVEKAPDETLLLRPVVPASGESAGSYGVELRGIDNDYRWTQAKVEKDDEGSVGVLIRDLAYGTYRLTVTSEESHQEVASYSFELLPIP